MNTANEYIEEIFDSEVRSDTETVGKIDELTEKEMYIEKREFWKRKSSNGKLKT